MRKKKTTQAPEQVLVKTAADQISRNGFIAAMRRLTDNEDFRLLRRKWVADRYDIIEEGKKKRDGVEWAVLEGFDKAVMVPEVWAAKEVAEEQNRKQAADLMASLSEAK